MNRLKIALISVMVLLVASGGVLVAQWLRSAKAPVKPLSFLPNKADMGLKQIHLTEVKAGDRQWDLEAKSAQYFQEENLALLKDIKARIFSRDGRQFDITGDSARLDLKSRDVEVRGNIIAKSSDGYELRTESLKFIQASRKIITDSPVVVKSPQFKLEGVGLVIDLDRRSFRLLKQVEAREAR
jgi:LPS export ABC transporter protein LptC